MHIFVDVDNICGNFNVAATRERVKAINKLPGIKHWRGNSYTAAFLKKNHIRLPFQEGADNANSADHDILGDIMSIDDKIMIITEDGTFIKLALYLFPEKKISFMHFDASEKLVPMKAHLCFKSQRALHKFVVSLALYINRKLIH